VKRWLLCRVAANSKQEEVWKALALMCKTKQLFADRYELEQLPEERTSGPRGVVAFADVRNMHVCNPLVSVRTRDLCLYAFCMERTCPFAAHPVKTWGCVSLWMCAWRSWHAVQDPVAIKFFSDHAAFVNERMIYGISEIAQALGDSPVFVDNADGQIQSPSGFVFPPHSVMQKGQSLEQWLQRFEADIVTSMQVSCC
jgi:hypothetical protein